MDINTFIEMLREEATEGLRKENEERQKNEERCMAEIQSAFKMKNEIKKMPYPDETDAVKKVVGAEGQNVVIEAYFKGQKITSKPHKLHMSCMLVFFDGKEIPLDGGENDYTNTFVVSIKNAETGEQIFENPFDLEKAVPVCVQNAAVFGKNYAVKKLNGKIWTAESDINNTSSYYDYYLGTLQYLDQIPPLFEEGKKYIYPERIEQWGECVCNNVKSFSRTKPIKEALKIMREIENDDDFGRAEKLFYSKWHGHTELPLQNLDFLNIVTAFSKKGPEFFRKLCGDYNQEILPETEEYLRNIEAENENYAGNAKQRI